MQGPLSGSPRGRFGFCPVGSAGSGGARINRDSSGNFLSETGWSGSGGGPSKYEPRPAYQDIIQTIVGGARGVPDYSFDADPNTGVSVYDSTSCKGLSGWLVFGGTSVSAPLVGGVYGANGKPVKNYAQMLYNKQNRLFDVTSGSNGSCGGTYLCTGKPGYDGPTGLGTPDGIRIFH